MSGETTITVIGNLTADPELRFTPKGDAVASFTVASTPRKYNQQTGKWDDGDTLFLRCSIWKDYAEHVCESARRGGQVIVVGHLVQRSYDKDGEKRTVYEMQAQEVGVGLRFRTFQHSKDRARQAEDPWAATPGEMQDSPVGDEPPF